MEKRKIHLLIVLIVSILTGCAIQKSQMVSSSFLNPVEYKLLDIGKGDSESKYIFGIGGLNDDGLMYLAKIDLYKNVDLRRNQTLSNLTVDNKYYWFFPIYYKHKVILSADIIEYIGDKNTIDTSKLGIELNKRLTNTIIKSNKVFEFINGDKVVFKDSYNSKQTGIIVKIDNGYATIEYTDWNDVKSKTINQKLKDLKRK